MKDSSKVIMGATLVMVVSLAIVLGLVLVLLVELYCSILLRRRRLRNTASNNTTTNTTTTNTSSSSPSQALQSQDRTPSPLSSFYAQGVLDAPRSFLFPAVSSKENNVEEMENQSLKLHSVLEIQTQKSNTNHHHMGIISPPSQSTPLITSPLPIQEIPIQVATNSTASGGGGGCREHFVYISNPIYDNNDASRLVSRADTPFETPDTSPSRLETDGSSGEDDEIIAESLTVTTPPLTPMKKLPAEACSVSLRDVGTSGSDSVSNNGLSSSSSGSPRTSPSW